MRSALRTLGHRSNPDKLYKALIKLDKAVKRRYAISRFVTGINIFAFVVFFFAGLFYAIYCYNFFSDVPLPGKDDPKFLLFIYKHIPQAKPAWLSWIIAFFGCTLGCALIIAIISKLCTIKAKSMAKKIPMSSQSGKIRAIRLICINIDDCERKYQMSAPEHGFAYACAFIIVTLIYILLIIGFIVTKAFKGQSVIEIISLIFGMLVVYAVATGVIYLIALFEILFLRLFLGFTHANSKAFSRAQANLDNVWVSLDPQEKERRQIEAEKERQRKEIQRKEEEEKRRNLSTSIYSGCYSSSSATSNYDDDADWEAGCIATGQWRSVFGDDFTIDTTDM